MQVWTWILQITIIQNTFLKNTKKQEIIKNKNKTHKNQFHQIGKPHAIVTVNLTSRNNLEIVMNQQKHIVSILRMTQYYYIID